MNRLPGCTDTIKEDLLRMCTDNGIKCKTCVGSKCNSEPAFSSCLTCKSSFDCAVSTKGKSTKATVCKAYADECFTFIGKRGVERGCLATKPKEFVEDCRKNPDKCNVCKTPSGRRECNSKIFDVEYCAECDSSVDMCAKQPGFFRDTMCDGFLSNEKEGCYLRIEGGRYQRGCVRNLSPEDKQICLSQSSTCKTCTENNCNTKKDFLQCINCNSKDDFSCSGNTNLTGSICDNYMSDFCMSGLDASGYTQRYCTTHSEFKQHSFKRDQFEFCGTNNCNTKVLPTTGRHTCYRCDGDQECDDINALQSVPCGKYSQDDQCYTYVDEGK